ncbi:MAG TPA: hypothetical protein VH371_02545 [Candidatus Limnocylindrales bacterium]|jgi:hypothetical protein
MSDKIIDDYLHELRVSAWVRQLPEQQAQALEHQTREKIAADLVAAGNRDEETVYGVLDRLGPAADIVGKGDQTSPTGYRSTLNKVLAPIARLESKLRARGWGLAEIGGLLLLIVGPFLLWWIGPIFGILLIRYAANRWSDHAEHRATQIVFGLLGVQVLLNFVLILYVLVTGGSLLTQLQGVLSSFTPGRLGNSLGPSFDTGGPLSFVQIVGALLAPAAGLLSGFYLALSPRFRR